MPCHAEDRKMNEIFYVIYDKSYEIEINLSKVPIDKKNDNHLT